MALTRKFLTALGIEPEKIDEIIEAHSTTVDGLKNERDGYKENAEKYESVSKELETANERIEELEKLKNGENVFETKYNELKEEFDTYKSDIEAKETHAAKEKAYRELLKDAGVSEKRIDSIIRITSLDEIELDKDGKIKDSDKKTESIKEEWSDFIVAEEKAGAPINNPLINNVEVPKGQSRAAQLAEKYHTNLYGATKTE